MTGFWRWSVLFGWKIPWKHFKELAFRRRSQWCWKKVVGSSINIHHAFLLCLGGWFFFIVCSGGWLTLGNYMHQFFGNVCEILHGYWIFGREIWKDHMYFSRYTVYLFWGAVLTRWFCEWKVVAIGLNPCKSMLKYLVICKKFHPQRKGTISCQTEASLRAFFASRHSPCPMVSCNCPKTNATCWTIDIFMFFRFFRDFVVTCFFRTRRESCVLFDLV